MIAKGTCHNSGSRLAAYMIKGKDNERAELYQVRGFASDTIHDAFRSVDAMARGTKIERPFFHVQVRNPEGEHLTRAQWEQVANRIESKIGYSGQGRTIAFHIDQATGHEHMHVAWSRIDGETLQAKPLPFFKLRLKEVCRELEVEMNLTRVTSERSGPVMAPKRAEEEQARRFGIDLKAVRQSIRDCWEQSDNGRAFVSALADKDLTLAQGDRRDYVVIDREGGIHALGKRILGTTAAETRARLGDLDRATMPTVEEARDQQRERQLARGTDAKLNIAETSRAFEPTAKREAPLNGTAADIRLAWNLACGADELETALAARGITLAQVTAEEARTSERVAAFAKEAGRYAPTLREGEIVAVTAQGDVYRLDRRTTGEEQAAIHGRLVGIDRDALLSVTAARSVMIEASRAAWRDEQRHLRDMNAPLTRLETRIGEALAGTTTGVEFAKELDAAGLTITRATAADILALDALRKESEFAATVARAEGVANTDKNARNFGRIVEGDFAAVTRKGDVIRLNPTALDFEDIQQRLADVQTRLPSIVEARAFNEIKRDKAAAEWKELREDHVARATARFEGRQAEQVFRDGVAPVQRGLRDTIAATAVAGEQGFKVAHSLLSAASKIVEGVIGALSSFFGDSGPKLTRQQVQDILRAEGNLETRHSKSVAEAARIAEEEHDDRQHVQKSSQQQEDLSLSARFGTPPTREANLGRSFDDAGPERER